VYLCGGLDCQGDINNSIIVIVTLTYVTVSVEVEDNTAYSQDGIGGFLYVVGVALRELCHGISLGSSKNRGRKRRRGLGHELIIRE